VDDSVDGSFLPCHPSSIIHHPCPPTPMTAPGCTTLHAHSDVTVAGEEGTPDGSYVMPCGSKAGNCRPCAGRVLPVAASSHCWGRSCTNNPTPHSAPTSDQPGRAGLARAHSPDSQSDPSEPATNDTTQGPIIIGSRQDQEQEQTRSRPGRKELARKAAHGLVPN
jgi:hypothetical protein